EYDSNYENETLQNYVRSNVKSVDLYYYEERPGTDQVTIEGKLIGSWDKLSTSYQFNFLKFQNRAAAEDFLQKNGSPIKPAVTQLSKIENAGACTTISTFDHFWQAPARFLSFRAGDKFYSKKVADDLTADGTISGTKEKTVLLEAQKLCVGDSFRLSGHKLQIIAIPSAVGINLSSAPGATFPAQQSLLLADETGNVIITDSLSMRRVQKLSSSLEASVSADSDYRACGDGRISAPSAVKSANAQDAITKALKLAELQCKAIDRSLDLSSVQSSVSHYDPCMGIGRAMATAVIKARCK
ncbi:MAG: hypothetical protein ACXVBE_11850, partial [Bdellovibrionota bacterium]